jgi:hypothetical protein
METAVRFYPGATARADRCVLLIDTAIEKAAIAAAFS